MRIKNGRSYTVKFVFLLAFLIALSWWQNNPAASTVQAAGVVTDCSEAGLDAALVGGGTLTFNCGTTAATIALTTRKNIATSTYLDGQDSPTLVTLDGYNAPSNATGMFYVNNSATLRVSRVNFQNAKSTDQGAAIKAEGGATINIADAIFNNNISSDANTDEGGGAIYLGGATATLTNTTFTYNKGSSGGAIHAVDSYLTITASTFNGNQATGNQGGAIYAHSGAATGGVLILESNRIVNNSAKNQGGGLSMYYSDASKRTDINHTTFDNNSTQGLGGGIFNSQGVLNLINSTLSNNSVPNQGGGLWLSDTALVKLSNVTVYGNRAYNGQGGGIARPSGSGGSILQLVNVTLASNFAGNIGGGLDTGTVKTQNSPPVTNITLANTIVANNRVSSSTFGANCSDSVNDGGNNLQWQAIPNAANCTASVTIADPKLATLADTGGPTQTAGLLSGSPALNVGNYTKCTAPQPDGAGGIDQRGAPRTGGKCDIGAFEGLIAPPTLSKSFSPSLIARGGTTTLSFVISNPDSSAGVTLTNISFSDVLPGNLRVASPQNLNNGCGSGAVNVAGGNNIGVTGVSVAGGGSCTLRLDVTDGGNQPITLTNSVTTISATATGFKAINAQASLTIVADAPYGLQATLTSNNAVSLNWRDDTSRQSTRIERSPGDTTHFALLTTVGPGVVNYLDSTTTEGNLYYYRVQGVTSQGSTPYSNYASVTTNLNSPTNLTATVITSTEIDLSWANHSSKQTGFHVERRIGPNGGWAVITNTNASTTTYNDTGLTPGKVYYYRVRAFNASLVSFYSNEVSALTPGDLLVTNPTEDGSGAVGTLNWALGQAATNQTIYFQLDGGAITLTVQSGITLTAVSKGVNLGGKCGPNGPGLTISGGTLQLQGNNFIYGLRLIRGSQTTIGPLIANVSINQPPPSTGNFLSCVSAGP